MKKIIIAMAAIAAAFTMASCNKEQLVEPEKDITPTEGNCIITASTESNITKTSLYGNDTDGYEVVWSEGDSFKIGEETFTLIEGAGTTSGKFQGTLPEGDGPFTAYYPATYNGIDWPALQTYTADNITGSPMKASVTVSGGKVSEESLSFKNAGGILRLTLKGTAQIKSIKVSADDLDEITLDCGSGVTLDNTNGTVFHIAMPEGNYSGVSIAVWTTDYDDCTKKLKEGTQLKIERSKITTASFTAEFPAPTPVASLTGSFSVADGKQVSFSRGNLYYDDGFKFEAKQCNFHGYDSSSNTWGLFGWSTAATNYGMSTLADNTSYSGTFYDWGKAIGDGKTWRTLTSDEWQYLFETRPNADKKYGYGRVYGTYGLIILPDEFTDPMKNNGSGAFVPQISGKDVNGYSLGGNWEAMEAAGAVFLPIAGYRGESVVYFNLDNGMYWSSSADGAEKAYYLDFQAGSLKPAYSVGRHFGLSVRLVTDLYTVTFDMNGKSGTAPESLKEIAHGSKITKPSDPTTIIGYEFAGWYKDKACSDEWRFDSDVVTSNITLYAAWRESSIKAIISKFTVNSNGKQVYFSAGNLIATIDATGAPTAWRFAVNQYDYLEGGGANKTIGTAAGDVDLFGWSTAATTYGISTSENYEDYFGDFVDWGKAIGDGGIWYTLAEEEWKHLFKIRPNAADKYGLGMIGDVSGLIILPDVFTDPMKNGGSEAFVPGTKNGYSANVYNLSGNWEAMEAAGAVFLPCETEGYYWSSTPDSGFRGWTVNIDANYFSPSMSVPRYDDCFVRLVTDVTE